MNNKTFIIFLTIIIISSCGSQVKENPNSLTKFEIAFRFLPDSLSSPFNHPSVRNNPKNPWADSEFQKIKNRLWKDTSLLFPLSDFDKILCFKYKKFDIRKPQFILNKKGYFSDEVITPGSKLSGIQAEQLLAIINDTSAYDRRRFNGVFSSVKIFGLLFIKEENKVVGLTDIYEDHIVISPVIPRACYGSVRLKGDYHIKIINIIKEILNK
ncbi:MAG: hypothetical protein B6D61_14635 [Bacteroidetes bacterium 4484_249]|nr:MAG: hypothetical protein B6D61_14635 [Bacteroidetes bacterium 4484_249]